jgi:hypothetical protein
MKVSNRSTSRPFVLKFSDRLYDRFITEGFQDRLQTIRKGHETFIKMVKNGEHQERRTPRNFRDRAQESFETNSTKTFTLQKRNINFIVLI